MRGAWMAGAALCVVAACGGQPAGTGPDGVVGTDGDAATAADDEADATAEPTTTRSDTASERAAEGVAGDPRSVTLSDPFVAFGPADGRRYANAGAVVDDGGVLHSFRTSFDGLTGGAATDVLASDDGGATWPPVGPVVTTEQVSWAENHTAVFGAVATDDGWVAFVTSFEGSSAPGVIGRATAPGPGGPWTVEPDPVVEPEPGGYRAIRVAEPSVLVEEDGTWRMWFAAYDAALVATIGHATSPDGTTWTVDDEPVFVGEQSWDTGSVDSARVVRSDDEYLMLYGIGRRATNRLGLASSPDGLTWTPFAANPVVEGPDVGGGSMFQSSLVAVDGELLLLQEAGAGGISGSTDVRAVTITIGD